MISYAVPRERDRVLLLRKTCPDRGVRDNLLHSIQDSAFVPEAVCSAETDNSKMFLKKIELIDSDWQQTCLRALTFWMKPHSPLHESFFGLKQVI